MPRTFSETVEGVGDFVFRSRTIDTTIRARADAVRMLGGVVPDVELMVTATTIATLRLVTEQAPPGWSLGDDADPFDPDLSSKVAAVFEVFRSAEETFRKRTGHQRTAVGPAS